MNKTLFLLAVLSPLWTVASAEDNLPEPDGVAIGGKEVSIPLGDLNMYGVLFEPDQVESELPAIVLVHGWMPYDVNPGKEYSHPAREYADQGFVTLSVTLRGWSPTGGRDDCGYRQPRDIIEVVKWLSERQNVDESRIALWGQSLGGQVILSAAVSKHVKASVAYFPVTDFRLWGVTTDHSEQMKQEYIYGMCAEEGTPEARSPLYTAHKITGPVLLLHGDSDGNVLLAHSKLLHQRMSEFGLDASLFVAVNGGHGSGGPGWENHMARVIEFLKAKL